MFVVGQKVRCTTHGEGVVTVIEEQGTYPVEVDFANGEWDCYTEDGEMFGGDDDEPSLFVIEE